MLLHLRPCGATGSDEGARCSSLRTRGGWYRLPAEQGGCVAAYGGMTSAWASRVAGRMASLAAYAGAHAEGPDADVASSHPGAAFVGSHTRHVNPLSAHVGLLASYEHLHAAHVGLPATRLHLHARRCHDCVRM